MGEKNLLMRKFIIFSVVLFVILLIGGIIAFFFSLQQINRDSKGMELSQQLEIKRMYLETKVNTEISLVLKMASSPIIKNYLYNPQAYYAGKEALLELRHYRSSLNSNSIFWVSEYDRMFYMDDREPYYVDVEDPDEYWYLMTLNETEKYNFNINHNPHLGITRIWINAPVFFDGKPIGVVGTGIDLSSLIDGLYQEIGGNYTFYLINSAGEITGALDKALIAEKKNIENEPYLKGHEVAAKAIDLKPGETANYNLPTGKMSVGTVPALDWYTIAFMPDSIQDYDTPLTALFLMMVVIVAAILIIFNIFIARNLNVLKETMVELEVASKTKSEFLATMSHEIRTPLNAIIGIAQIQLQKSYLPEEDEDAFKKIFESGSGLLNIINDILDMSKIETGKLTLVTDEYDTPSLINDAVQLNVVNIGAKPIDFVLEVDENLLARLYGDELRIKQVLNNLLSNAIKYTKKGYVKLSVSDMIADGDDVYLSFAVEDSGQGMKAEDREKLFSKYQRFNAEANRDTEGTGLGLNITMQLVEMMGGKIEVQSEYGKGSIFTATIKQKAASYEVIGSDLVERLKNFTFTGHRQQEYLRVSRVPMPYGKVLVVDDVSTNLFVAEGLLIPYKLEIELVDSGYAAIDKVEKGKIYDVIFMDHMMPHMDGVEATEIIRKLGYQGTVIALTANALVGNDEMFKQHGFDAFISKPIDIRQLNAVLNKYVRDRHPEEAKKYKESVSNQEAVILNPRISKIMCRDAEKGIETIRESLENYDIKMFTTTVHGLKSALANFGEKEASEYARKLEKAAYNEDMHFINDKIDEFIMILRDVITRLTPVETVDPNADITEDTTFLKEQLGIIKTACEDYDDTKVFEILDLLGEKIWKNETVEYLAEIRETLFLHSDFELAVIKTVNLINKC